MRQIVVLKPNQTKIIELILDKNNQNKELYIFFVGRNIDQFILSTISKHLKPNTISLTIVRGVLFDQAQAKIDGMIEIGEKIKNCDAFLDQKILLIGDHAHADVRPQLEIKNNEVKASHAASIGRVDKEQLFYLMSRGLDYDQATDELVRGFFQKVINNVKNLRLKSKLEKELLA